MSVLSESLDLGGDTAELIIDANLDEGILKEIPILSSALAIVRLGRTISDRIFFAKIRRLLLQLAGTPVEKRIEFQCRLQCDSEYANKVGECLVLICDSLNNLEKAEMLGVTFSAHVRGAISLDAFRRIASAIDVGYIDDLLCLATSGNDTRNLIEPYMFRLTHTGLTTQRAELMEDFTGSSVRTNCEPTNLGRDFLNAVGKHYEPRASQLKHLRKQ